MHGHAMSASNCARIMHVMAVRAHEWVAVCEKTHALMKRIHITCNGKYMEIAQHRRRRRQKSSPAYIDSYSR